MATVFEQSISHNTRCFTCGSLVYAVEKKMTTHHVYHNRCFRCRICKRNLTGYSLNEDGDDIYCANCYRRKQRGDCNSLEFYRAAAEKAQYVHYRHHPNQQHPLINSRSSSYRETVRNPSLTLRQLERQVLSHQPSPSNNNHSESTNETNGKSSSVSSHPFTINTNFSTPVNLTKLRRDSSLSKDEASSRFSPVFSPIPTVRTETTITPRMTQKSTETMTNDAQAKSITLPTGSANGGIEFRLNKSSVDLTNITSSLSFDRKNIIIPDLNPGSEQKESKYRFPDLHIASIRRRSSSVNPLKTALRVD